MWIYITTFAVLSVFAWFDEEIKETLLERTLDILLASVTLVGLLAYARRFPGRTMIRIWKGIAPIILIGYVLQLASTWPGLVAPDPELTVREQFYIAFIVLAVATIFLVPAIVINFRFARGRHLVTEQSTAA